MNNIINDIKQMVEKPIDPTLFPVKKGNKILLGNFYVVDKAEIYAVKDKSDHTVIETNSKLAAIAAGKLLNKGRRDILEVLRLDDLIEKKSIDCAFYKNKIAKSNKWEEKECAIIRFEDSRTHVKEARDKLKSFIYPKKLNNTVSNKGRE
jgi:hypothetical protein